MSLQLWLARQTFRAQRQAFYEDLAEALDDKAQLAGRIEVLATRAAQEHDVLAPLYRLWLRRMDDRSFSSALTDTVPAGDVMILHAAEQAGRLPDGLRFAALVIGANREMTEALYGAVIGFVFLSAFLVGLLALFSFYGIGLIEELVPPDAWPWVGRMLRDLAHFVTGSGIWVLACLSAAGIACAWSLRNWSGRARVWADRYVPVYTIYRDFHGGLFLVALAALMRNKVSLNDALDQLSGKASPWLRWHIRQVQLRLDYDSDQPGKAFATGIFSKPLTWRIIDFGERSSFPLALEKVGLRSIDMVTRMVKRSAGKINKLLLILSGGLMAFIIAGTFLTMYEAQNAVQRQISTTSSIK